METNLLQYEITDWKQLAQCKSNNSPDLKIKVSQFVQNPCIEGTNISVIHPKFGVLLSYTILPKGKMITDISRCCEPVMTSEILLNELRRYGFYVYYSEEEHIPSHQIRLLKTIQGLNFDKLRICVVHDDRDYDIQEIYVTAFTISSHDQWINAGYSPSKTEWTSAILDGTAMNVSGLDSAKNFNWSWLYNRIVDINDLLSRYDDES